jgi:putative two-component system response regulator
MITGLSDREDRLKGIEAGADDFLTKPISPEELFARVNSLLKLKEFTDELETADSVLCTLGLSVEARDPYTEGHCERLARDAADLGAFSDWTKKVDCGSAARRLPARPGKDRGAR